jgi:hypothetical protein
MISVQYYLNVTGELEKVPPLSRVWSRTYPRSWVPHERAAMAYIRLGQFEKGRSEEEQARQLADNTILTAELAFTEIALDRFQDARNSSPEVVAPQSRERQLAPTDVSLEFSPGRHKWDAGPDRVGGAHFRSFSAIPPG